MLNNNILTRISLILIIVLALGFTVSCDDDNNSIGPSTDTDDLLGSDTPRRPPLLIWTPRLK